VEEMGRKLSESLEDMTSGDVVILQLLDNTCYMSRTEEGGDLPIRQFNNGEYHVDGEVILAGKDRQYLIFNTILPLLRLVEGRNVILVTPTIRYVKSTCCEDQEHATNWYEAGFEEKLRADLDVCRQNFKDFTFTAGIRGFRVCNPSPTLPGAAEDMEDLVWGEDPVHPLPEGYERITDLLEREIEARLARGEKRKRVMEDAAGASNKKPRMEQPRADWITGTCSMTSSYRPFRGGRGGGWGRPFRGRPFRARGPVRGGGWMGEGF